MKIVCGLFKWNDGGVTAAALRDDMFNEAGVELLIETFSFCLLEAFDLADAWNTSIERIKFVSKDELSKLRSSLCGYQMIGDSVLRVRTAIDADFVYHVAVR